MRAEEALSSRDHEASGQARRCPHKAMGQVVRPGVVLTRPWGKWSDQALSSQGHGASGPGYGHAECGLVCGFVSSNSRNHPVSVLFKDPVSSGAPIPTFKFVARPATNHFEPQTSPSYPKSDLPHYV
ncbi:hypothetical protein Bbelb_241140 [Branchiostoma belcheri]|nr:hypothetical protein Bbelb_241140 [Branchiostoma belcheri]